MKENKSYPIMNEEDEDVLTVQEPVAAYACEAVQQFEDLAYAQIVDGVLQITPDIEEEISEVERGETVSMDEFKTMFARWLD